METSKSFIGQVNLIKVLPWDADINAFGFSYYQQTWTIQFQNFSGHQLWTNLPRQDGGGFSTSQHTFSGYIPKNFYWKSWTWSILYSWQILLYITFTFLCCSFSLLVCKRKLQFPRNLELLLSVWALWDRPWIGNTFHCWYNYPFHDLGIFPKY